MSSSEWTTGRRRGRRDPRGRDRAAADPRTFVCNSLAAKAQSVGEIEAKLAARGVGPEEAAAAISEAIRLGYLDDAELAGQLARGLRSRGYGRRRALQTLRRRRLPSAVAEIALEDAYGDVDEDALARAALGARTVGDDPSRRRAASFLVRRGFSPGAAWSAVGRARSP
jgi:SOS response regulatory protein OraA/RecX